MNSQGFHEGFTVTSRKCSIPLTMPIKKSLIFILALLMLGLLIVEALVVVRVHELFVVHEYNGHLNRHVAQPYEELVEALLARYEAGDMDALGQALKSAEERKYKMGHVWLNRETPEVYRTSVAEILK